MIYTTLLNIAIFQGIVLGLIILKSSIFNSNSNKYLAFLLFALSIVLLNYVFEIEGVFTSYPLILFIDAIDWVFLLPVFTFLFIINRIDDAVKNRQKTYLCYIPFAYASILNITVYFDKIAGIYKIPESYMYLINILQLIQILLAIIIILFLPLYSYFMIRHLKDPQEKNWVLTLLTALYLVLSTWLITYMAGFFFEVGVVPKWVLEWTLRLTELFSRIFTLTTVSFVYILVSLIRSFMLSSTMLSAFHSSSTGLANSECIALKGCATKRFGRHRIATTSGARSL
mgnify:CR=1 FL=1